MMFVTLAEFNIEFSLLRIPNLFVIGPDLTEVTSLLPHWRRSGPIYQDMSIHQHYSKGD